MSVIVFNWYGQPFQPATPALVSARAIARNTVELEFDELVIVRESEVLVSVPSDRYTPVSWPGSSWAAANPENYAFTRPNGGNLDGPGEAVDLVATYAEEHPEESSLIEIGGTEYVSTYKVWVHTDFQHTARADYHVQVSNVRVQPAGPGIEEDSDEADWVGYVVSQVDRSSLDLWDIVSGIHRRDDTEGTGDLAKLFTAFQEVLDRMLEDIDAFFNELSDIDKMRPEFLDTLLWDLGDPFRGVFDLTTNEKRKLASVLVQMYREKGTCVGIINAVRVFLGVTLSGCIQPWTDAWELAGGSYPSPIGGDELGVGSILGPGTAYERLSFQLVSPIALTQDQRDKIEIIAEYMKPAHTHFVGIDEP